MASFIRTPRIVLAALRGGAGKTLLSVGIVAALRKRGYRIGAFKKGPDYIDAGWLGLAADGVCHNLDPYLFSRQILLNSFAEKSQGAEIAIVEGNRGLFDGVDAQGSFSTAEMSKTLKAPAILIIDTTKMTRTAAAMALGCCALDPSLKLKGIILNRVGGSRQERVVTEAIEHAVSVPVVGCVRKLSLENFPQRHLGLLPLHEHPGALDFIRDAAVVAEQSINLDRLVEIAAEAGELALEEFPLPNRRSDDYSGIRIGVIRDSAFQFYYPENLEALSNQGAELVFISALKSEVLPDVHAVYIGGGFPETHAEQLAQNNIFKRSLYEAVERGLPVYAECGGLMYLCRTLRIDERVYPMTGVFQVDTVLERKPQGLGYIQVEVTGANPFFRKGDRLTGHEFHYSSLGGVLPDRMYSFSVLRGHGMDGHRDGLCRLNALGTYMHLHALGEPRWAGGLLRKAAEFKASCEDSRSLAMVVESGSTR
jgi:cobyrinic acid a,c-diamide synthase